MKYLTIPIAISILLSGCMRTPSVSRVAGHKNEIVVLLHGLARSSYSMNKMQEELANRGYDTCNIPYPSRHHTVSTLSQKYVWPKVEKCIEGKSVKLSFVTHSMGGIIVRDLLKKHHLRNLNAVVMLSPPNHGSEIVDKLRDNKLYGLINGPAGKELGTNPTSTPNKLGSANFTLGIITGSASINLILSSIISGKDDGKVSVKSARLKGMTDFLILPVSHTFIMKDREAIRQTIYFLEHHRFDKRK